MPAQFRVGIPMTSSPLNARSLVYATVRLVVSPSAACGGSGLLDFLFGLIGILLLFLQVCCGGGIRRGRAALGFLAPPRPAGREYPLSLFFLETSQTVVELFSVAIVAFFCGVT